MFRTTSSKPPERSVLKLHLRLDRRSLTYGATAAAAGVSALALVQPSEAEVIFTPAHQTIPLSIDLDHDGLADFTVGLVLADKPPYLSEDVLIVAGAHPSNGMIGTFVGIPFASALTENTKISADANFLTSLGTGAIMFDCARGFSTFSHGEWKNVSRRFLGLEFRINGENHFGWARLSVRSSASNCATRAILTGFAYETDPNRPINAGQTREDANTGEVNLDVAEPATLGRLARGTRLGASREH